MATNPTSPRSIPATALFGADLRLLGNLDRQNSRERGSDLATARRPESGEVDLARLSGIDNLKQALLLRFLTPLGEMEPLGHSDYGSRLSELIGERNTETNRNRAKLFVLQALAAEPRVAKVLAVDVTTQRSAPTTVDIAVRLVAISGDTPLNLVFPFSLAG
jgi:phage baseplate assembly protein W